MLRQVLSKARALRTNDLPKQVISTRNRDVGSRCERYFASLLQTEEAPESIQAHHDHHHHYRLHSQTKLSTESQKAAETILQDIQVGAMNHEMWNESKEMMLRFCKSDDSETAHRLLRRLLKEAIASPSRNFHVSKFLWNSCLSAFARSGKTEEAERLVEEMIESHKKWPDYSAKPDLYCYNILIKSYAHNENASKERVQEILDFLEESPDIQPDFWTYNQAMMSVLREDEYGSPKLAEDILLRFSQRYMEGFVEEGPNVTSFNTIIKAWSEESPDRSLEIYRLMQKLSQDGYPYLKPTAESLSHVMQAFSKKGNTDVATELIKDAQHMNGNLTHCYNGVLAAWAHSGHPEAGQEAQKFLETAEIPEGVTREVNETSHRLVIQAYAESSLPEALGLAYEYLTRIVQQYRENRSDRRVLSVAMFHLVLRTMRNSRTKTDYSEKALELLDEMKNLSKYWDCHEVQPQAGTYSYCLDILVHSRKQASFKKAVELLREAEETGCGQKTFSMNHILKKLTEEDEISESNIATALELVEIMGDTADIISYNSVLGGLAKVKSDRAVATALKLVSDLEQQFQGEKTKLEPGAVTYTAVMKGLMAMGGNDNAVEAVRIFDYMARLHRDPTRSLKLDLASYKTILTFLSQERTVYAARQAQRIVQQLIEKKYGVYADPGCLSAAIIASARAPNTGLTHQAHRRLIEFSKMYQNGTVKFFPHPVAFTAVINAWGQSREKNASQKAGEVFDLLNDILRPTSMQMPKEAYSAFFSVLSRDEPEVAARHSEAILQHVSNADVILWNTVLAAWARSDSKMKLAESLRVLDKMPRRDLISYNTILKAVSTSLPEDKDEALRVGYDIFDKIKSSTGLEPDEITYGSMIVAHRKLLDESDPGRRRQIEMLVEECMAEGFVGDFVWAQMRFEFSPDELKEKWDLELTANPDQSSVPTEWCRNASKKSLRRIKRRQGKAAVVSADT